MSADGIIGPFLGGGYKSILLFYTHHSIFFFLKCSITRECTPFPSSRVHNFTLQAVLAFWLLLISSIYRVLNFYLTINHSNVAKNIFHAAFQTVFIAKFNFVKLSLDSPLDFLVIFSENIN